MDAYYTQRPGPNTTVLNAAKMVLAVRSAIQKEIPNDVHPHLYRKCLTQQPLDMNDLQKFLIDSSDAMHRQLDAMDRRAQFKSNQNNGRVFQNAPKHPWSEVSRKNKTIH